MSYPSEKIRITPLLGKSATKGGAGSTSLVGKTRYNGQGDFSVRCFVHGGTAGATEVTATAAANWDFSVIESTAATVAGSVITGATMTLGAAAALTLKGAVNLVCKVASNLATTVNLVLNGATYHISTAGATAKNGALALAEAINGSCTGATSVQKLPHYTAIGNYSSANLMLITGDDDLGTGITAVATSGGVQIFVTDLQGMIDVQGSKLSTNVPKYIGVACTDLTGLDTSIVTAELISHPTGKPAMPGVKVSCTT
jgi:hypothetical protein